MVCDNVLTQAAGSHVGEHGMAGAFHDKQHRAGERDDDAHNADDAADAHKDRAHKDHDAHSCLGNLFAGRSAKFLNLGLKAMVSEDIGNDVSGCTLLLAACRRDAGVLQQVVEILWVFAMRAPHHLIVTCRHTAPTVSLYIVESIPLLIGSCSNSQERLIL